MIITKLNRGILMIFISLRCKICLLSVFFLFTTASAQQILDEIQLIDISDQPTIQSTVIRDPEQALLIVKTQIATLRVQSNNIILESEQVEPGTMHIRLAPGTHRLSFQAEGFISVQERFYFNPKDVKGIQIRVVPAAEKKEEKNTAIIVIKSTPDSAAVFLNDLFYGTTPYLGKTLAGHYKLELRKEPYPSHEEQIIIIPGETLPVNVDFSKDAGSVQISSKPANAKIELDNRYIGETPLIYKKLAKGKHKILVTLKDYETFEAEFEIDKYRLSQKFDISLKAKESTLSVLGSPKNAEIAVDDSSLGYLPMQKAKILYGAHKVTVAKPGFFTFRKDILISSHDPYLLNITLEAKSKYSALLYSTLLPGSGQIYSGRTTTGIILGASTLGCATVSLLFTSDYNDKNDQYMIDKKAYDNNTDLGKMDALYKTTQDSYSEMEDAHQRAQIMWGLTIAVWFYNMADAVFFFPGQNSPDLSAETDASGSKLVFSFHF
jgi:hypothetical protein